MRREHEEGRGAKGRISLCMRRPRSPIRHLGSSEALGLSISLPDGTQEDRWRKLVCLDHEVLMYAAAPASHAPYKLLQSPLDLSQLAQTTDGTVSENEDQSVVFREE